MNEAIEKYRKERDAIIRDTFAHNGRVYYKACIYRGEEATYYGTNMRGEGIAITLNSDTQDIPDAFFPDMEFLELTEVNPISK